jgi:hypothetical protein
MVGDLVAAENYIEMLLDYSSKHTLALWHAFGRSYQGVLIIKRGDTAFGFGCCVTASTNSAKSGTPPCD